MAMVPGRPATVARTPFRTRWSMQPAAPLSCAVIHGDGDVARVGLAAFSSPSRLRCHRSSARLRTCTSDNDLDVDENDYDIFRCCLSGPT